VLLSLLQSGRCMGTRRTWSWSGGKSGIGRDFTPQVYYSLEKLERAGMIRASESDEPAAGPERSTFATTAKGSAALANALEQEEWTTQRERPPFLTWMRSPWQARPGVFTKQMERRREFLEMEITREKEVLASILEEVGHSYHEAVWMVSHVIEQFKLELRWLRNLNANCLSAHLRKNRPTRRARVRRLSRGAVHTRGLPDFVASYLTGIIVGDDGAVQRTSPSHHKTEESPELGHHVGHEVQTIRLVGHGVQSIRPFGCKGTPEAKPSINLTILVLKDEFLRLDRAGANDRAARCGRQASRPLENRNS